MSTVKRPPVASWLLRRFVSGPMRDSLIGDIEEQFARGRTSLWYWRQLLPAVVSGLQGDLRERPFAIVGSVILTTAATLVWVAFTSSLYAALMERFVDTWVNTSSPLALFEFWIPFGGGTCLVWCIGSGLISQVGTRLTDRKSAVLIGVFLSQIVLSLWLTRDFWLHGAFTTSVSPRLWIPNYLWAATVLVGMPMSTLLGAFWRGPGRHIPEPTTDGMSG